MPEFRSAGESLGSTLQPEQAQTVIFPHLHIDLDKFPELSKEIGSSMQLLIRVRVIGKHIDSDNKSSEDVEIREIYVPAVAPDEFTNKSGGSMNDADRMMARLKGS